MRTRVILFCVVVIAICLGLVLHRRTKAPNALPLPIAARTANNRNLASKPASGVLASAMPAPYRPVPSTIVATNASPINTSNSLNPAVSELLQKPIDFYGQVLDESNNPVAGADVAFRWDDLTATDWTRTATTASGPDGLFSLENKLGATLTVSVSKKGYYTPQSGQAAFHYAFGNPNFSPDPRNPIVFHLRKKGMGTSLIDQQFPPIFTEIWQLHHDGTPIELDLLNGSQNVIGSGQLKLEFWRDLSDRNAKRFDWRLQISVPAGGVISTDEEFPFEAPENGYQPSIVVDMPKTNQIWIGQLRADYYIQLPNGYYGRFDLYFLPYNGVFTVKSWVNPTGSRNLEPKH